MRSTWLGAGVGAVLLLGVGVVSASSVGDMSSPVLSVIRFDVPPGTPSGHSVDGSLKVPAESPAPTPAPFSPDPAQADDPDATGGRTPADAPLVATEPEDVVHPAPLTSTSGGSPTAPDAMAPENPEQNLPSPEVIP
jgi:cell division septation protein DedD